MPTVTLSNRKSFEARVDATLLDAAKAAGIVLEHSCRTGRCGTCKAKIVDGGTTALKSDLFLGAAEKAGGWILTCATAASGDLRLDIEDLGLPADVVTRTLPCRIDSLERLAPDVMKVVLRLPPKTNFRYVAGQYIDLIGKDGLRRSYSIANSANSGEADGKLELHVRQVEGGVMSVYLFEQAQTGDLLRFEGPLGTFFLRDVAALDLMFLATGTGIAPVKSMLAELSARPVDERPRSVSLYWGGRHPPDLYWMPNAALSGLRYTPILSRADERWSGVRGHVQNALLADSPAWERTTVYACGSAEMIDDARSALAAAGLPAGRFRSDAFVSST